MGSVFISYRSGDSPWGAAGIHEWLARRLGDHRVFRDCVSLDPGTHYPTAIVAELEKADVLIAIIGPHWLTATDPETGRRLVDHHDDWVRRELAFAFERGIPVLPVLLKDTPADAHLPAPDDLPPDIRRLAAIQACEVSQRRLGTDLGRLADQILRILPRSAPLRPHSHRSFFYSLVDALEAVPCLFDEESRAVLINQLRPDIAGAIRHSPQRRTHAMNILRTCLDRQGGLADLIATIRHIEGGESLSVRRLLAAVHSLPPELLPDECMT